MTTYLYSIDVDLAGPVHDLVAELTLGQVFSHVTTRGTDLEVVFEAALSDPDKAILDAALVPADVQLVVAKALKTSAIDSKSDELVAEGFEHGPQTGQTFSLSLDAQKNWLGLVVGKDMISYPMDIGAMDNTMLELTDADAVVSFYGAAMAAVKGHLDSGLALKGDTEAATTVAEVDAVVDNR